MIPLANAAIAIGILTVLYTCACWLHPWARCPHCAGTGLRGRGDAKRRRLEPCRWCRGHRLRLRWGRRVFNHALRLHRSAHPTTERTD